MNTRSWSAKLASLRSLVCLGLAALTTCAIYVTSASAQGGYPTRPITMLVGFPPGGFTDFVARVMAKALSDVLGQPVVVENRGGANGLLATNTLAAAKPDGYTILMTTMGFVTNPYLYKGSSRDPVKDFVPISITADVPNILVTNPSIPAKNLDELLQYARARSKPLTVATTGSGAPGSLVTELLQRASQIHFEQVGYKGSGPAMIDVIAGNVDMSFPTIDSALQLIKAGKLRAVAVTGTARVPVLPDVPTMAESGLKDVGGRSGWYGLVAPAGTPKDIVARLSTEAARSARLPAVRDQILASGAQPVGSTSAEMATFIAEDYKRWGELIKASNIKGESP